MMRFITSDCRNIADQAERLTQAIHGIKDRLFYRYTRLIEVDGELPKPLKSRTLYVIKDDGLPWSAAMICPCGCGTKLEMNLLTDERPCWKYSAGKDGRASLHPSVWRKIGCKSHFWLRKGRIVWS